MSKAKQKFDAAMMQFVGQNYHIETFTGENNVWRSRQLRLESISNDDFTMER